MTPTTMRPDDDELVADLKRYFAATEVDEPPFRTRVVDAHDVARRSGRRWVWLGGTGGLAVAAVVVAAVVAIPRSGPSGASSSGLSLVAPVQGVPGQGASGAVTITTSPPTSGKTAATPQTATTGGPASAGSLNIGNASGKVERTVTATYTVPQGTFLSSFDGVISRAVGMGGYVASSTTSPDSNGHVVAGSVTLKVPADQLSAFIDGMPSSFAVSSVDFASTDHTADYVNLNAELSSAQAQLVALNTLLTKATALGDIISIEQQVAQVQSQINTYQGQINAINNEVDMATATVQLSERGATPAPSPSPNPVTNGLGGGWSNAVAVTGAVLGGVVTVLPLAVLAVLVLAGWVLVRRRRS